RPHPAPVRPVGGLTGAEAGKGSLRPSPRTARDGPGVFAHDVAQDRTGLSKAASTLSRFGASWARESSFSLDFRTRFPAPHRWDTKPGRQKVHVALLGTRAANSELDLAGTTGQRAAATWPTPASTKLPSEK